MLFDWKPASTPHSHCSRQLGKRNIHQHIPEQQRLRSIYVIESQVTAISTLSQTEDNQAKGIEFATLVKCADFYEVRNIGDLRSREEISRTLRFAPA